QSRGEAKFLRAYAYSLLSQFYGDVPLVTTTLDLSEAYVSRDAKSLVVDFILSELIEAADLLPATNAPNTMAISGGAANALASRVPLYNERWPEAISAADAVMALGGTQFELHPNYEEITHRRGKASKGIIWAIQFNHIDVFHETPVSFRSRMSGGYSNRMPVQALIDSYPRSDGLPIDVSPLYDPAKPFENRDPR